MKKFFSNVMGKMFGHGKSVWMEGDPNKLRSVSCWDVIEEAADTLKLRTLNLWAPLGTYHELTVARSDNRLYRVRTY